MNLLSPKVKRCIALILMLILVLQPIAPFYSQSSALAETFNDSMTDVNLGISSDRKKSANQADTWLYVSAHSRFKIGNAEGQYLEFDKGEILRAREGIEVLDSYFFEHDDEPIRLIALRVKDSERFTFESFSEFAYFFVQSADLYAGIEGNNMDVVSISHNGLVAEGEDMVATVSSSYGCNSNVFIRINISNEPKMYVGAQNGQIYISTGKEANIVVVDKDSATAPHKVTKPSGNMVLTIGDECDPVLSFANQPSYNYTDYSKPTCEFTHFDATSLDAINFVCDNGLMKGISDGKFAPAHYTTRAMLLDALYRLDGGLGDYGLALHDDVRASDEFANAASWSRFAEITGKYQKLLNPYENVTHGEVITAFWKYAQWCSKYYGHSIYMDGNTDISEYSNADSFDLEAVRWAASNEISISSGSPTDLLSSVSREELASYIYIYCMKVQGLRVEDTFSFSNTQGNFASNKGFLMTQEHYEKLISKAKLYGNDDIVKMTTGLVKEEIWEGSCHGISTTIVLDRVGKLAFNENVTEDVDKMWDIPSPNAISNPKLYTATATAWDTGEPITISLAESIINYYQCSQYITRSIECIDKNSNQELVETQHKNGMGAIGFSKHAVVLTGQPEYAELSYETQVSDGNGGYLFEHLDGYAIQILDCNDPGDMSQHIFITTDFEQVYHVHNLYESENTFTDRLFHYQYYPIDSLDILDIDGDNNVLSNDSSFDAKNTKESENTYLFAKSVDSFVVTNTKGEKLIYLDSKFSGNMEMISMKYIYSGSDELPEMMICVPNSSQFTFTTEANDASFYVAGNGVYAGAEGTGMNKVVVKTTDISVSGTNMDVKVSSSYGCASNEFIIIEAQNESLVTVGADRTALKISTNKAASIKTVYTDWDNPGVKIRKAAGAVKVYNVNTASPLVVADKIAARKSR